MQCKTVRKTGDSPGAVLGDDVDVPVVLQRQVLGVGQCRKLWRFRSCRRCSSWNGVDAPVAVLRQVPGGSDSTENSGSAAVAVHRRGVVPLELAAASSSSSQCAV